MKSSECRDKQIMELSGSKNKASYSFFNPDEESDEEFHYDHRGYGFRPTRPLGASHSHPSVVRNCSSVDHIDSVKVTREKVGMELVSEINQTMKEHFDNLLHSVDGLSSRLSQLESKTHQLENAVDDLKVSAEYNNGRTDGKLRQLETILREVQDGIHFLRDRQEIAETQLQLAKLQVSKSSRQSEDQKTAAVHADSALQESSSASEQSPQPLLISGALSPAGAPVATQLHTQVVQNPIPSTPPPQSYYLHAGRTFETTYQQYNVPPTQQAQPPPPIPSQLYQPVSNLPQVSQSPELPQLHPPLGSVTPQTQTQPLWTPPPQIPSQLYQPAANLPQVSQSPELPQLHPPLRISQTQPPWTTHHPEETPPMPSHNYRPSIFQSSSQPPNGPPTQQFYMDSYMDSSHQMHGQSFRRPNSEFPADYSQIPGPANFSNMHPYSGSPSHYNSSTMKPSQLSPFSPVTGGGNNYTQLPKAQILPHALPTASSVDAGSSSGRTGNKAPIDDVVDKVTAMGFRRDLARATVRKLTENGQAVDLNAVLDKLMNNNGAVQP